MISFIKNNSIALLVGTVFAAVYGIVSILTIPKEATPSITIPVYTISVVYPGADPTTIEEQVVTKLEQKFKTISLVKKITSTSTYNLGLITVEFYESKDDVVATNDIKQAIDQVYPTLPSDVRYPTVKRVDINDQPIYTFAVADTTPVEILYTKAKKLENKIKSIPGVSDVIVIGKPTETIKLIFDADKIAQLDLDFGYIVSQLRNAFFRYPADKKDINQKLYSFEISTYEKSITGLVQTIKNYDLVSVNGRFIKVKDIAEVLYGYKQQQQKSFVVSESVKAEKAQNTGDAVLETRNALTFQIKKTPGYDVEKMMKALQEEIKHFQKEYPMLQIKETYSLVDVIQEMFNSFVRNFIETGVLVFVIVLLFLGTRTSLVILMSFIIVYVTNFIFLKGIGYTFNNIVSFSLILLLGIMIDNLIVIAQGITLNLQNQTKNNQPLDIRAATRESLRVYARPVFFGTLTTIVVFVPLYFGLHGIIGQFMKPMPVTIISNLLISLLVALVIIPLLAPFFLGAVTQQKPNRFLFHLENWGKYLANLYLRINKVVYTTKIPSFLQSITTLHPNTKKTFFSSAIFFARKYGFFLVIYLASFALIGLLNTIPVGGFWLVFAFTVLKVAIFCAPIVVTVLAFHRASVITWRIGSLGVVVCFLLFFLGSLLMIPTGVVKTDFMDAGDSSNIWINMEYPAGISLQENQDYTYQVAREIIPHLQQTYPNVIKFIAIDLGAKYGGKYRAAAGDMTNFAYITLRLVPKEERKAKSFEITEYLQTYLLTLKQKYPFLTDISAMALREGPSQGKPVGFYIVGDDYTKIGEYVHQILPEIKQITGVFNVTTSIEYSNGKFVYLVNENKAKQLGVQNVLSFASALAAVQNASYEPNGIKIKEFNDFGDEPLPMHAFIRFSGSSIERMKVGKIYLEQILEGKRFEPELKSIDKLNGEKAIKIEADKLDALSINEVFSHIKSILAKHPMPEGVFYKDAGDLEQQKQSMQDLGIAMVIGLFLMYLVLIIQFNNIKYATITLMSTFLSLGGSIFILRPLGLKMTFVVQLAIFGVLGVGVNQALIHIEDFKKYYEQEGMTVYDAFRRSIAERFVPIFLTNATTIIGLFILALSDEFFGGLAWSFIGGLFFSFFVTLFFMPSFIRLISREKFAN